MFFVPLFFVLVYLLLMLFSGMSFVFYFFRDRVLCSLLLVLVRGFLMSSYFCYLLLFLFFVVPFCSLFFILIFVIWF